MGLGRFSKDHKGTSIFVYLNEQLHYTRERLWLTNILSVDYFYRIVFICVMRGYSKFCQRGSNFDMGLFFLLFFYFFPLF